MDLRQSLTVERIRSFLVYTSAAILCVKRYAVAYRIWGSSVSIVPRLLVGRPRNWNLIPGQGMDNSSNHPVSRGFKEDLPFIVPQGDFKIFEFSIESVT